MLPGSNIPIHSEDEDLRQIKKKTIKIRMPLSKMGPVGNSYSVLASVEMSSVDPPVIRLISPETKKGFTPAPRFAAERIRTSLGPNLANVMKQMESIMADEGPPKDKDAFQKYATKSMNDAMDQAAQQLESMQEDQQFDNSILDIASIRLKKYWRTGQCFRNYSITCPVGWRESPKGSKICVPRLTTEYTGPCHQKINTRGLQLNQLEELAWRCGVDWACKSPLKKDFSKCPLNWINVGKRLCIAPPSYEGPCSPATDFANTSERDIATWSFKCRAPFPDVAESITIETQPQELTRLEPVAVQKELEKTVQYAKARIEGPIVPKSGKLIQPVTHK